MSFTNEAIREIHEWVKKDGSKVGRIVSAHPLAINKRLVEVVWTGVQAMVAKPTILYVCNTTLEAELLDRQLKDKSFCGGRIGEQSAVSKDGQALGSVVLLSYARLRQLLDADAQRPFFPSRVVVVCEQEPGSSMDAVVARGQFALHARETLVRKAGFNVKLLGLSYRQDGGRDWLKQAVHVMSTSPPTLSMDLSVSLLSQGEGPQAERTVRSDEVMARIAADAAAVLKQNRHVVVYGSSDDTSQFWILVEYASDSDVSGHDSFVRGVQKDAYLDEAARYVLCPRGNDVPASLVQIEPGSFSTPLPLTDVGMVVSIVTSFPRRVYNNHLHLVTSSVGVQSLQSLKSQRWTGRGIDGAGSLGPARIVEIFGVGEDVSLPMDDFHIQNGTHDPLRECFAMVAAYPAKALNLLPIFKAVDQTRDLVVRLRAMGLLTDQGNGFVLTGKGRFARGLMDKEASLTLEAATALAGIDMDRMGEKVARSILRICFMRDMSDSFVEVHGMGLNRNDEFESFLSSPARYVNGGPGRECAGRGLIWLIWTGFESLSYRLGANENLAEGVVPGANCPFYIETAKLKEAVRLLAAWERLLDLDPIPHGQRHEWNVPLTPSQARLVESEIARANYSTAMVVPFRVDRSGQVAQEALPAVWLRTNEPAEIQGEFDKYLHANRLAMTKTVRNPAPSGYKLFGGLPLSISTNDKGLICVTGLMWFDYDVIKSLIGDLEAEDADPWVREVAMRH